jgi:heptosyltransferase-1
MPDYRRILIIKPSSLGDVVHALPTLAVLRQTFPHAHIAWLVKRQWAGLLERAEGLDAVWPVESGVTGWLSAIPRLRAAGFDLAVDLQGLLRSGALARLAGCPTRIGFANAREGSPFFYTHRVSVPATEMHAVDRYLLVAAACGATVQRAPEFRLRPLPADRQEIAVLLSRHGLPAREPWIGVSVSARWPTKRWPPEFFATTADRLQEKGLGRVVLIGGPDDRAAAQAVKGLMRTAPVDLAGATTPALLPALLESAALLLTNDSGPMHVAAAMGTPVVALFGPTSPTRTGPYGNGHHVLRSGIPCSPCYSRTCRNTVELECLRTISPDRVIEAVRQYLKVEAKAEVEAQARWKPKIFTQP